MIKNVSYSYCLLGLIYVMLFLSPPLFGQAINQQSDDLEDIVNIDFRIDIRIFTVMAALNAAGFDYEQEEQQMSAVRTAVREHLEDLDADLVSRLKSFYRNWSPTQVQTVQSAYTSLALLIHGPPDFKFQEDTPDIPGEALQVTGFSELLPEFYQKADLEKLWNQYRGDYILEIEKYRPVTKRVIRDTLDYFRIPARVILDRQIILIPDLMSHHNVVNARNMEKTYYIIVGPTEDAESNYYQLQHEYLHFLVDPLIQKYGGQLLKLRSLLDLADDQPYMSREFRGKFLLVVGESLIEALLARFHPPEDREAHEVELFRKGFIFAPSFMSALDRFDETPDVRLPLYLENIFQKLTEAMINADHERIMEIRKRLVREQYAVEEARQKQIEEQKKIQDAQDKFKAAGQMINEGDFDTAEALLRELLEQDPDNGNVLFYLAQIYAQRQDYDQALEYYLKASDSSKIQDWVRAWSLLRAGRYYAARQNYEEARRIFGQVLKLEGDLRGALEEAEQLIGRLPKE